MVGMKRRISNKEQGISNEEGKGKSREHMSYSLIIRVLRFNDPAFGLP